MTVFYAPDVVYIPDRTEALGGAKVYVGDERTLGAEVRQLAGERRVETEIAHDGMEVVLR